MSRESVINFFRIVKSIIVYRPRSFIYLLKHKELYVHTTYFQELTPHKTPVKVFFEQILSIIKYGAVNKYYFPYGFDVKTRLEMKEYVDYNVFMQRRDELNLCRINSASILRNKLLFNVVANGIGVKTAKNSFFVKNRSIYVFDNRESLEVDKISTLENSDYFCKLVDGECGVGIFILRINNGNIYVNDELIDIEKLHALFDQGSYLAQEIVCQHEKMKKLHPNSINSMRLVTVKSLKDGKVRILPSILRIGIGGSIVDNTSRGGIAVGIDIETGRLKKYGFYKPEYGLKTDIHPDSNIRFEQFEIPYFKEAKEMAIRFHEFLDIHSVGWDVAISPDGPVFIEGNDNWEINGPQICNGGFKREFDMYFYK